MRMRFLIRGESEINAIEQACRLLAEALRDRGHDAGLKTWRPGLLVQDVDDADVVILPYNPFMWGYRGVAPRLVRDVFELRRRPVRPRIALVVHEPFVEIVDAKTLLLGVWQRFQLQALIRLCDHLFASIEAWTERFGRNRRAVHLPSGSTLPDARARREELRASLGVDQALVVATLSTGNPAHLHSFVEQTLSALWASGTDVVFWRLGAGAPEVAVPSGTPEFAPGRLTLDELAAYVAATDLLLAPFVDGVSTRRTSFTGGLCEGICVLGTTGPLTDPLLLDSAIELVDVRAPSLFVERAVELAHDHAMRAAAAASGRQFFESELAWPVLAERFLREVG